MTYPMTVPESTLTNAEIRWQTVPDVVQTPGKAYMPAELKPDDNEGFGVICSICSSHILFGRGV